MSIPFGERLHFKNEAFKYMNPADKVNYKLKYTKPVLFKGGNSQVYIHGIQKALHKYYC